MSVESWLKYQLSGVFLSESIGRLIDWQSVKIASVVTVSNVSVNRQLSIGTVSVVNQSTIAVAFTKLVPNAFPFVLRYLTADTQWTRLLVMCR